MVACREAMKVDISLLLYDSTVQSGLALSFHKQLQLSASACFMRTLSTSCFLKFSGRDDGQPWRRNEAPPVHKEDELRTKDEAPRGGKPAEEGAPKDWRSNWFAEEDRVWRKQGEEKTAADRERKEAPVTPPPKGEEPSARADQVPTWRRGGSEKTPEKETKPEESAAHLLPEDLLFGGGKEEAAAESLWDRGEHENDEAYTEGGAEQPVRFFYKDPQGETQGPFLQEDIEQWMEAGFFTADLPVRRESLPESAPFVPLGTALPHLKPKTPRMPPGYEQREPEAGRPVSSGGVKSEQSSRPGTGKEAGAGAGETAGGQGQQQASIHGKFHRSFGEVGKNCPCVALICCWDLEAVQFVPAFSPFPELI
jgi:hypothetical protein